MKGEEEEFGGRRHGGDGDVGSRGIVNFVGRTARRKDGVRAMLRLEGGGGLGGGYGTIKREMKVIWRSLGNGVSIGKEHER
jgi:hypothetical protein